MKKLIAILICLCVALSSFLVGCNSQNESTEQPTSAPTEAATEAATDIKIENDVEPEEDNKVEVVRLMRDVQMGTQLAAEHLITNYMEPERVPTDAITDYDAVIGKYVTSDLKAGAYFYIDNISITKVDFIPEAADPPAEDEARKLGYLIITDYVDVNAGGNLAAAINKVILDNPNRTIFFPDGEYLLTESIMTPANPVNSVSLYLSNYAVIKASPDWSSEEALIRLGAAEPYNDIYTNGSNYYLQGGIIDGNFVANGVSIDSGRETSVRFVSIKHTKIGLYIKTGANGGSSDSDIDTVNITGTNEIDSIGVLVEGYDNTISNMRIASVQIGLKILSGGNILRNLHPLQTWGNIKYDYKDSIGFWDLGGTNFYDYCYSDNFAVGFRITSSSRAVFDTCFCFWYSSNGDKQIGFSSDGQFNAVITTTRISVRSDCNNTAYLQVGQDGGKGAIEYPICNDGLMTDKTYKKYTNTAIIPG